MRINKILLTLFLLISASSFAQKKPWTDLFAQPYYRQGIRVDRLYLKPLAASPTNTDDTASDYLFTLPGEPALYMNRKGTVTKVAGGGGSLTFKDTVFTAGVRDTVYYVYSEKGILQFIGPAPNGSEDQTTDYDAVNSRYIIRYRYPPDVGTNIHIIVTGGTASNSPSFITKYGILNANPSQYSTVSMDASKDMGLKIYRTGQILDKGYNYTNAINTINSGFSIVHNISGHISNVDSTRPFLSNDSLSNMLTIVFSYWYTYANKNKLLLFAYDNEEDNAGYHGYNSLAARLEAYRQGQVIFYTKAHANGFLATNGGITGRKAVLLLAYYYQQTNVVKFRAVRDAYSLGESDVDTLRGQFRLDAIDLYNYLQSVKNYIDYLNIHWYDFNASPLLSYLFADAMQMSLAWTGKKVITNEIGAYSVNPDIVSWEFNGTLQAQWPYCLFYFGNDASEAAPANDQFGVLNANGNKVKDLLYTNNL